MQIEFELVKYDEELDTFELDETMYQMEISDEDAQTYELLKSSDLNLYNWLQTSDFFLKHVIEEIYPDSESRKIAISDINGITFRRFTFSKSQVVIAIMSILKNFLIFSKNQIGKIEKRLEKRF